MALSGVDAAQVVQTLKVAAGKADAGLPHATKEQEPVYINLRLPVGSRSDLSSLCFIYLPGARVIKAPVYAISKMQKEIDWLAIPGGYRIEQRAASQPWNEERSRVTIPILYYLVESRKLDKKPMNIIEIEGS